MKIATVLQAAATLVGAFSDLDLERNSIEVPRIGQDVNVTCGGKEIRIEVSPHYIQRNSAWLGDGSFLRILLATVNYLNSATILASFSIDSQKLNETKPLHKMHRHTLTQSQR